MADNTPVLGKILTERAYRDAIHIAIEPVQADCILLPGQRVSLVGYNKDTGRYRVSCAQTDPVGIVDPFLEDVVKAEQEFYLFLFPNTITDLRHVWRHPKFKPNLPEVK